MGFELGCNRKGQEEGEVEYSQGPRKSGKKLHVREVSRVRTSVKGEPLNQQCFLCDQKLDTYLPIFTGTD